MCEDYKKALEIGRSYAKDYPKYQYAYTIQGCALAAMGKPKAAEELIQKVVANKEIGGVRGNFVRQVGLELQRHGYNKQAQKCFNHSIELYKALKPKEWKKRRGDASFSYSLTKQYDKSEALAKELAAENPDNVVHQGRLGLIAAVKGDRKEAMRVFSKLGETKDVDAILLAKYWQSMIAARLGKKDTAVKLLREVFEGGWAYGTGWYVNPNYHSLRKYKPFKALFKPKG
jgi:predicted Zn-dependent protease